MGLKNTDYEIRPARVEDAAAVAAVRNAWALEFQGDAETTEDEVRRNWQRSSVDIGTDTRVAELPSHGVIGYAVFSDSFWDYARLRGLIYMHPDHADPAVESDFLDWIEERASVSLRKIPAGPRAALSHLAMAQDTQRREQLLGRGYFVVHHAIRMHLRLPLRIRSDKPEVPAGFSIRPCDRERDLPAISAVVQEAFQDHWGFVERSTQEDVARYERWLDDDPGIDMGVWHLACMGDEVIGICLGTVTFSGDPEQAYVFTLGVREAWRGVGVGRALLIHAIDAFQERGCAAVDLDVDTTNLSGALRLYESVGMQPRWQTDEYEKELRAAGGPPD